MISVTHLARLYGHGQAIEHLHMLAAGVAEADIVQLQAALEAGWNEGPALLDLRLPVQELDDLVRRANRSTER